VIELLDEMAVKADAEKKDEATRFSAFDQWCGDQTRIKNNEIAAATENIAMLAAKIEKAAGAIRRNTDRIEELQEDVGRWEKDTKSATDVREREAADYRATSADYAESLEALDGALATLKRRAHKTPQAELAQVLLQVNKIRSLSASSKRVISTALKQQRFVNVSEMPADNLFHNAPEAYGYEFQSGGVVDILEKLKDEFSTKKYELDHEELSAQHAFEDIAQFLNDNIENANHEIQKKTLRRANLQQEKAETEEAKAQTESDRAEDQKYLDETKSLCFQKTEDFNSRQKLRAGELEALREATGILRGEHVTTGDSHLPQAVFAQQNSVAFVQLGNGQSEQLKQVLQSRVAAFLADRAKACNSRLLQLASEGVGANPFVKVKKMIKDMISKLTQEATSEIEHKGWCDTELTTNKQTRDQKTEAVDQLTAEKEDQTSTIAQLSQEIEDLTSEIKELEVAMAEAEKLRAESKAKNEQTIADAKAAQRAVEQATAVLKDFYAKSAQATAFAQTQQTPAEDAPETFDKPYKGLMTESGSIVDFMEVILSDFVRLESNTATSEQAELDEHKRFMFEATKDKALKENAKGHKEAKMKETQTALAATEEELQLTQNQLDKAIAYYEKLKPTCVDSGITYEERVKRREEEIQSLQEALKILTGTDVDLPM